MNKRTVAFHGLDNFSVLLRCERDGTFIHVENSFLAV